jgi:hypothetical protein
MLRRFPPRRLVQLTAASFMTVGLVATQAGAVVPSKTVSPKQWAKTVCPALSDFVSTFTGIDEQLSGGVTPPEAQAIVLTGIDDSIATADNVVKMVKRAGTPDAKKGKQAVATFNREFDTIRDTLADAGAQVGELLVDDPEFGTKLTAIRDEVISDFDTSFTKFDKVDKAVNKALNANATCKAIGT